MAQEKPPFQPERRLISAKEAALVLGVSPLSVYRLCSKAALPTVRIGGMVKIDLPKLQAMIDKKSPRLARVDRSGHPAYIPKSEREETPIR